MGLNFDLLKETFLTIYDQTNSTIDELADIGKLEMWAYTKESLWKNCLQIEEKWAEVIDLLHKNAKPINWLFFGEFPASPKTYLYNSCLHDGKIMEYHMKHAILHFDLIPLTIKYHPIDSDKRKLLYQSLFTKFEPYRKIKWEFIKKLVNGSTHFGLTKKRQFFYISTLKKEIEPILKTEVHIDMWKEMHGKSFEEFDRFEKLFLSSN